MALQLNTTRLLHRQPGHCVRRWACPAPHAPAASRQRCIVRAGANNEEPKQPATDVLLISSALGLTAVAGLAMTFGQDQIMDFIYGSYDGEGGSSLQDLPFTGGDVAGAALWSLALWFASPLQVLLLFLGFFEKERPSDWLMNLMGRAAGLSVDAIDYEVPGSLRATALMLVLGGGVGTAALLELGLGDATWSVSSGIGMCLAAAVYELGRPERLSKDQAIELEGQWQDFAKFADVQLLRKGRCHESEVYSAFRKQYARYRRPEALPDSTLRDMVRNWHPDVERTRTGYLKNLSLRPRIDPFTGEVKGNVEEAVAAGMGVAAADASGVVGSAARAGERAPQQ